MKKNHGNKKVTIIESKGGKEKPDYIFNLETKEDFKKCDHRFNYQTFIICILILIIFLIAVLRAKPDHILDLSNELISVITLIIGYWLGKMQTLKFKSNGRKYEKEN